MRELERNKQDIWYALMNSVVEAVDDSGYKTGELTKTPLGDEPGRRFCIRILCLHTWDLTSISTLSTGWPVVSKIKEKGEM